MNDMRNAEGGRGSRGVEVWEYIEARGVGAVAGGCEDRVVEYT